MIAAIQAVTGLTGPDLAALGWFVAAWLGYGLVLERTRFGRRSLNARMDRYRIAWMDEMAARDVRIVDANIMAGLQNGAAFFTSTALLGLGGSITLLRGPSDLMGVVATLPFASPPSHVAWEIKAMGRTAIAGHAFFKCAWSYRLMNYAAILIGATPAPVPGREEAVRAAARRAAAMNTVAGRQFNRGQRTIFFALGYLGWFLGPAVFAMTTGGIVAAMAWRQFASSALRAVSRVRP